MRRVRSLRLLLGLIFAANIAVGCSTHETVTNEVTYDASGRRVERETTTSESGTEHEGALSGTLNTISHVTRCRFVRSVVCCARFFSPVFWHYALEENASS